MYFQHKNIDFDINENYVSEESVKKFFNKAIAFRGNVNIYEINVEDDETSYIYIEKKESADNWDSDTIGYVKILENIGYDVLYADEDYGECFDVLIIYNNING